MNAAVTIFVPAKDKVEPDFIAVRIMHPLHCLMSKLANRITLGRTGLSAQTQLEATTPILREFVEELLARDGEDAAIAHKAARRTLLDLAAYLERDLIGRRAHDNMERDPLAILIRFADDARIPAAFRAHNVAQAIDRIKAMRLRPSRKREA